MAGLHVLKARLLGGIISKAQRAELKVPLPVGLVCDPEQRVVLDPDQQVQNSLRHLFATFVRTGSAWGAVQAFRREGVKFPRRGQAGAGEITRCELTHAVVLTDGSQIRVIQLVKPSSAQAQQDRALRRLELTGPKSGHHIANKRGTETLEQLGELFITPDCLPKTERAISERAATPPPTLGLPPNGVQARDLSRELRVDRPAQVGATPLGDGLVCWSKATEGVLNWPRGLVVFGSEKEALEIGKT
jgi:hypothetical protein